MKSRLLKPVTIAFIIATIISSCEKNDSEGSGSLIGDWILNIENYKNCTDPLENELYEIPCNSTDCITLTFKNDGTFEYKFLESGLTTVEGGNYSVSGDKITCEIYNDFWCESDGPVSFKITGTMLTITWFDGMCTDENTYTRKSN